MLGCAVLLAGTQLVWGNPTRPLPDLPMLAITSLLPLALAVRIVKTPGAASAVCGAYLLPRSLLSLANPSIEPPPLLLVPGLALDVCIWLRSADISNLKRAWPGRTRDWRRTSPARRGVSAVRAGLAGGMFGLALAVVEPPFAVLLGADATTWSGGALWLAAGLSAAGCAVVGLIARGTGW